ncbi:MAG: Efflux ABC transporter, permease protein, partial [uncultured Solirubrobacterales bacterium]
GDGRVRGPRSRAPGSPPRARGDRRGAVARAHGLPPLLALDHLLLGPRADDLPARLRLRLRGARLPGRGLQLHRVRRHRRGGHCRALLLRLPRPLHHLHQAPFPAHLRLAARRPDRRRGARDRGGPVARTARRYLRDGAAPRGDGLRPRSGVGHAGRAPDRIRDRLRLRRLRGDHRGRGEVDRQLQLRDEQRDHASVPGRRDLLPDRRASGLGLDACAVQPAAPLRRAGPRRRLRLPARARPVARGRAGGLRTADVAAGDLAVAAATDRL